ncbi:uncharacterized protein [Phyllobates terribilis]|uniref:uncharacterized protein n=1 Tax=Phyllobates terribilis TaxID=111132 RepID=UPI003CCADCD6
MFALRGLWGAHLKPKVREKIWKGEYVDIFSLLPLERFNLDRARKDDSKKEDEEKRRYRLIPRTFANWLQAFAILANVIVEKAPENCSGLFCYLDAIGEAYRVYGRQGRLRYDEQFRQRKAVRPSVRWYHKDIALWLKVTAPSRSGHTNQPFLGSGGGLGQSGYSSAVQRGLCFLFNEGSLGSVLVAGSSGIVDRFGMPSRIMESSLRAVKKLIGQSSSTRTWSSYEVAWQQWEEWKATMRDPLESDSLLLLLVGHCWEEGWSVPKINNFMAGLAFGFKIRGLPDVTKATLVREALKGWRKGWKVRDCRRPISYGLLLTLGQLLGSVCKSPWEVKLFRLAFSLAFFGALRLGELVSPSRFVSGGLLKDDVDLYSDRVEVFIRFSKTDQFRKGCKVVLFAVAGSDMCPVRCLSEFGLGVGGFKSPLLVHEDGSFLSRFQLIAVLKKCLKAGGISPKDFSGHSFRIGPATEAARRGLGDELVKKIGRWESIRFRSYIRPAWV